MLVKEEKSSDQLGDCSNIKKKGGLSIGNIIKRNKAPLGKWFWR